MIVEKFDEHILYNRMLIFTARSEGALYLLISSCYEQWAPSGALKNWVKIREVQKNSKIDSSLYYGLNFTLLPFYFYLFTYEPLP